MELERHTSSFHHTQLLIFFLYTLTPTFVYFKHVMVFAAHICASIVFFIIQIFPVLVHSWYRLKQIYRRGITYEINTQT